MKFEEHQSKCLILMVMAIETKYLCVIINPPHVCAARAVVLGRSVYDYSGTTGYEAAYERFQQLYIVLRA